jgi:Tetratricopeptide repeat
LFERALRIYEASHGLDHPNVAISLDHLGLVVRDLGELVEARSLFERALRIREAGYGSDHRL